MFFFKKNRCFFSFLKERLNLFLISIFIFFLPTQLGKHFFFNFSYINGIKTDYLSLVFYFTDILIFIFFIFNFKKIISFLKNKNILILFVFLMVNLIFSENKIISSYQVLRIFSLFIVFFIGKETFKIISEKKFLIIIFLMSLFQLSLSILQISLGRSIQGFFYFFGERLFNLSTSGIAKGTLDGIEFLRPYGTFSHPNSLAGFFILLYFFVLTYQNFNKYFFLKNLNLLIFSFLIFISFSKTAIISFLLINFLYYARSLFINNFKSCYFCFFSRIIVISIVSLIFIQATTDPLTISKRVDLMKNSIEIIFKNPVFGVGLGNYLIAQSEFFSKYFLFFNQPVHNIFLLFFSEFGFIFGGLIIILFFYQIKNIIKMNIFLSILIFLTGFFDHYWFTLQQNRLLVFFVYGIVSSSFFILKFKSKS